MRDQLLKQGLVKVNLLSGDSLSQLNKSINSLAKLFALRYTPIEPDEGGEILDDLVLYLSKNSPGLLYEFSQRVANSAQFLNVVASDRVREIFGELTGVDDSLALIQPSFDFLINPPGSRRLQYNWHTAFQSYPKRSCFLNFWMPACRPKESGNGTLQVCVDSHNYLFPWVEGKALSRDGSHALTQNRVPKSLSIGLIFST